MPGDFLVSKENLHDCGHQPRKRAESAKGLPRGVWGFGHVAGSVGLTLAPDRNRHELHEFSRTDNFEGMGTAEPGMTRIPRMGVAANEGDRESLIFNS